MLIGLRRPNVGREHSLAFFIEFGCDTGDYRKVLDWVYVEYVLFKGRLILKPVATLVRLFVSIIQCTDVIFV